MRSAKEFGWVTGDVILRNGIFEFEPDEVIMDEELPDVSWKVGLVLSLLWTGIGAYLFGSGWGVGYIFVVALVCTMLGSKVQRFVDSGRIRTSTETS